MNEGILDKLDKFIPGHKKREEAKQNEKEFNNRQEEINKFIDELENTEFYKPYMDDEIRHAIEFDSVEDLQEGLLYAAISERDIPVIKYFANLVNGDFDLKHAVEDVDDVKFYDFLLSLNKDPEFWIKNTSMKKREDFHESVDPLISGANFYL